MVIVRYLEYLTALARERHFARAAAVCHVTQPTLSAGIKQLEKSLGVLIVARGRRFVGLTAEGERVLGWAQRVLADYACLEQQLDELRDGLAGRLSIGAVPVSLPVTALVTAPFAQRHPHVQLRLTAHSPLDIQRGLDDFTLDAGITYLGDERPDQRTQPLYRERYVLVTPVRESLRGRTSITWAEAAAQPLCLLTPDMQNRRIIDMHFREVGAAARTVLETNELLTLWSHIRMGGYSSIVPHTFLLFLGEIGGLMCLPLVEPDARHRVGLVVRNLNPLPPLARALLNHAQGLNLTAEIEKRIASGLVDGTHAPQANERIETGDVAGPRTHR
jgi:DNA-binding transcriptional LysR family regulator